jgi:hypothetical protein
MKQPAAKIVSHETQSALTKVRALCRKQAIVPTEPRK